MTQHTRQRYNYAIAQEVHKGNFEKQLKAQPETTGFNNNGYDPFIYDERGFVKALIPISFKPPLGPHHEAQPAPVTQPSIYAELQHLDIRERLKVIIKRMSCRGQGIGIFKPSSDKNKKK